MASVKVAVRVRPINKRERDMESKVIIEMNGKKTSITNPQMSSDVKDFTYDYSYWSMDSRDKHFASQEQVFCDLGTDVIDSAFEGYNACIFAYGQTGSGKSYTMMGCQDAVGLIPRICEALYERMSRDQAENQNKVEFKTEVSYLEIYNERVRDLLRPAPKKGDAFNLKVREHPKEGPYVQDLTKHIVSKYVDIEKLMDVGNDNRTTASTNMNDTSSRSHAIFTLNFTQAKFYADMPSETVSKIHLVDLAGSERADSTGATGQRLKEGANINKSLVTLGSVISALAELSSVSDPSAKKKHFIPYRDSVLTWLLKDSLGGNAKTIMIAAISPADVNYAETVSTLRYANRAKNIINKPTINEDANVRLIRELREEIENLRLMLTRSNPDGVASASISAEEKRMAEQLHKNEAQVQSLYKEWNNKWKETHKIMEEKALAFRRDGFGIKMESDLPHLICVDGDILSTGVTLYHLGEGRTHVGREDARVKQDIVLSGPGLEAEHCIFESIEGNVTLHPIASETHVNGSQVKKPLRLSQGAVILLGKTNMFRFNHPGEAARLRQKYASVENLASLVPTRQLEEPSYLFYNAGLEMERRYRQEAQELETKRREIEKMQAEDAKKLEEARKELEILADQRKAAEEEQRKELSETQRHLEEQREHLQRLKAEQDKAREKAQRELHELKSRIQDQQEEEKRKLDEEMRRLLHMKEVNQKTVEEQEALLAKRQEDLERQLAVERQKIEEQRKEVLRLQQEYEGSRTEAAPGERVGTTNDVETTAHSSTIASVSPRAEELRRLLDKLEAEYESAMSTAQREIQLAKNQLKQAEMATLQGKVNLMDGKSQLQMQWKQLDALHLKHKGIQDEIQGRIREVRAQLEAAEKTEEEELMAQERSIVERRKARKRVEEATQKLLEMENRLSRSEALTDNQDLLDWQNQEEVREMQEQRNILMELLSNHQIALLKASQLVTETKTKLENHLKNEAMLVGPLRERIADCELELEPLRKEEMQLERACQNLDTELKAKKKILYKQRKRINLLEKQHAQSSGPAGRDGLSQDERDELDREREAELELIQREKSVLRDMEDVFRRDQETAEAKLNFQTQDLEKRKSALTACLSDERRKLDELQKIHDETREFIEAELMGRREMLDRIKEKVKNDKKELARLDTKQQQTAAQAAEELFMIAEVLEKELSESGKKEELTKIKDHRKKLQELDRQLRLAEKREKMALDGQAAGDQQCVIL